MNKTISRGLLIPAFIIILMSFNFMRLTGSECIRTIHVVTLLTMGAAIGMLIMNIVTLIRNKNK
jgi:hypothetical protein